MVKRLAGAVIGIIFGAVALSGCAPANTDTVTSTDDPSGAAQDSDEARTPPWGDDTTPTVILEFTQDGSVKELSGQFAPSGLLSCKETGQSAVSNKSPDPGLGVMFEFDPEKSVPVSGWVVGDEDVAQFLGNGVVTQTPSDEGTIYSVVDADGWIAYAPRDPALSQINEHDMNAGERIDATLSFTVTCPAR